MQKQLHTFLTGSLFFLLSSVNLQASWFRDWWNPPTGHEIRDMEKALMEGESAAILNALGSIQKREEWVRIQHRVLHQDYRESELEKLQSLGGDTPQDSRVSSLMPVYSIVCDILGFNFKRVGFRVVDHPTKKDCEAFAAVGSIGGLQIDSVAGEVVYFPVSRDPYVGVPPTKLPSFLHDSSKARRNLGHEAAHVLLGHEGIFLSLSNLGVSPEALDRIEATQEMSADTLMGLRSKQDARVLQRYYEEQCYAEERGEIPRRQDPFCDSCEII